VWRFVIIACIWWVILTFAWNSNRTNMRNIERSTESRNRKTRVLVG
jgi:hypothetical protein